jgi:tight adherence protein C
MTWWQSWLQWFEPYVRQLDAWRTLLPVRMTPLQMSLLVTGVFLAISLLIMLAGRILIGSGRNRLPEADQVGSRRPLVLGPLTEAFAWIIPVSQSKQDSLRKDLVAAGYFHRKAIEEYLGFRNAAAMAWLVFTGCAVVLLADPTENVTPTILIGSAVVFGFLLAIPRIVLSSQSESRRNRIRFALPDSLDMINMMVTGGLPLRQAIQRVQKDLRRAHPDMACELAIISHHAETGSMDLALRQFASRVNIPDVTVLATMVRHAEQLGGNITSAFREFADSIRRTRRQLAEERGNKSTVKLMFPTILCLTPPVYILLLGPAVIEIKNFIQTGNRPGGALSQSIDANLNSAAGNSPRTAPDVPPTR